MLRGQLAVAFDSSVSSGAASSLCLSKRLGRPSPLLSPRKWTAVTVFWPARLRVYWTDSSQCSTLQHVFCATGGSTTTSLRSYVTSSTGSSPVPHRVQAVLARFQVTARSSSRLPKCLLHWYPLLSIWSNSSFANEDRSPGAENENEFRRSCVLCCWSSVLEWTSISYPIC